MYIDALKSILFDRSLDYNDFKNILLVGYLQDARITSLIKRDNIKVQYFNISSCSSIGELAAHFVNLEADSVVVIRYVDIPIFRAFFLEALLDRKIDIEDEENNKTFSVNLGSFQSIILVDDGEVLPSEFFESFQLKILLGQSVLNILPEGGENELLNSVILGNEFSENEIGGDESMSSNKAALEFEIKRGIIDTSDCDDDLIEIIQKCMELSENNNHTAAINLLKPLLNFEWCWSNCDGDPNDIFNNIDDFNLECSDNWVLKIDVEDNELILTAKVSFDVNIKSGIGSSEIIDWLNDNSAYSCGYVTGGWGYKSSDGDNVNLVKIY